MNEKILFGVLGLVVGVMLAGLSARAAVNNQNINMMRLMGMRNPALSPCQMHGIPNSAEHGMMGSAMSGAMQGMMNGLQGKTGDEFDKIFLAEMIVHHQGAIDMATSALKNAKHEEIKDLANAIISAQTKEIEQMKTWQLSWYK